MSRSYTRYEALPFEEDDRVEFKMHTDFSAEEVPPQKASSRRPISRVINGLLNSGNGGVIYLGVSDDGVVLGLSLTHYQKEHIQISVEDVCQRYTPPVPSSLYKLQFVPVVDKTPPQQPNTYSSRSKTEESHAHLIQTPDPCWCLKRAQALKRKGFIPPYFIVELIIEPTVAKPIRLPPPSPSLKPLFADEKGRFFMRRAASVWPVTYQEVIQSTVAEVTAYYSALKEVYYKELFAIACMLRRSHAPNS